MTTEESKALFFITHDPDLLKSVANFLIKRGHEVIVETDLKESIVKILERTPAFVFVAWDHHDQKVTLLPPLLAEATASVVVPYIQKNTKDSVFKFGACPYKPKLYPPVSGPAIERLILKTTKDDADLQVKLNAARTAAADKEELIRLQEKLVSRLNSTEAAVSDTIINENPDINEVIELTELAQLSEVTELAAVAENVIDPLESDDLSENTAVIQAHRSKEEIDSLNFQLKQVQPKPFSSEQTKKIQQSLQSHLQLTIENKLKSNQHFLMQKSATAQGGSQVYISKSDQRSSFKETRVGAGSLNDQTDLQTDHPFQGYALSLVGPTWCGYFFVCTPLFMSYAEFKSLFHDWLKQQFDQTAELEESGFFQFNDVSLEALMHIKKRADYSESLELHDVTFDINLIAMQAEKLLVELTTDGNFVKVPISAVEAEKNLHFPLWLHLPENKKYLLYTQAQSSLTQKQKTRLINHEIRFLFTSLHYEKDYRRYLLETELQKIESRVAQKINKT